MVANCGCLMLAVVFAMVAVINFVVLIFFWENEVSATVTSTQAVMNVVCVGWSVVTCAWCSVVLFRYQDTSSLWRQATSIQFLVFLVFAMVTFGIDCGGSSNSNVECIPFTPLHWIVVLLAAVCFLAFLIVSSMVIVIRCILFYAPTTVEPITSLSTKNAQQDTSECSAYIVNCVDGESILN